MKLAYLIMAHTDPKHLRRLVDGNHSENPVIVV